MRDAQSGHDVGSAAGIFVLAFFGCLVGIPVLGLSLGFVLSPVGLEWLAAGLYFPAFALWLGDLLVGPWQGGRWVYHFSSYHAIPLVVWLMTGAGFAWASRRLSERHQFAAAVGVILAVTAGMHLVLAVLGIRLVIDAL